ncbi:hypothetical protein MTP99_014044 [Tenebrio molitor]|nr:hypothetical protein MTP99_014044 [Tenebrio molitor]
MSIIANPRLFNISLHKKECPKNICLVVEAKICNEYFENCSQVAKNYTNFKSECHRSIARNTLSCINVRTTNFGVISGNHLAGKESSPFRVLVDGQSALGLPLAGDRRRSLHSGKSGRALSRLIGAGVTGGGSSTPEIRIVGWRAALSMLIPSGVTGGGPSTPEIRIVGRRVSLSKLIGSWVTGGGHSTPEIRIVGRRVSLSKLIGSGVTGGSHSTPEIRIVGRRADSGDYRRR